MPRFNVNLGDADMEALEAYRRRFLRDRREPPNRSAIVREAIQEYLAKRKPTKNKPTQEDEAK